MRTEKATQSRDCHEAGDREIDRILAMSGDELRTELVAEGHDPDALVRQMKQGLDGTLRLAADRQRWREEATSWRRVAERLETQMQTLRAKADDQMAYWRKRMAAEKSRDDGISEDGLTYTPIGDDAAWSGGYCNGRLGEAEWWQSTLKYMAPASGIAAPKGSEPKGLTEGKSPALAEGTPNDTPPLAEGDAHPLPDPFAGITTDPALLERLKRAAQREMTPAEHHAQRRSWIIGEMGIEHPELSREQLEALADHAVGPAPSPETGAPHPDPTLKAGD
ncbi:hypothetical protein ASG52_19935 [Methylobacterium sp. Leaf456]|nr:hypothetical protein ASG52_19935 [Methylobacterium sp. Leaf456]